MGKVINSETREPIAGARVQLVYEDGWGESDSKLQPLWKARAQATTSFDGSFEFRYSSWKGNYLRVEADGFGLSLVVPHASGHEDAADPLLVALTMGASLDVRIADGTGLAISGAHVSLSTPGYELDAQQQHVFSGRFVSLAQETWRASTAADGRCSFRNLPARVPLHAEVSLADKVVRRERDPIRLQAGEAKSLEWIIGGGTRLIGLALDQSGSPAAGLEIWLESGEPAQALYFYTYDNEHVIAKTLTNAMGRFKFDDVSPGKWRIGPAPSGESWKPAKDDAVAALAVVIEVAGAPSQEFTLQVYRGLFIRGRVVGPEGNAVSRGFVTAMQAMPVYLNAQVQQDGSFALGPLGPGTFELIATGTSYGSSDPVSARAGEEGVVLRAKLGADLRGRVVDRKTKEGCEAQVYFTPEVPGSGFFGRGMSTGSKEDGSFEEDGLDPGRWRISATTADGRFGILRVDAAAGVKPELHELTVSPGGKLRVRYAGSLPQILVSITIEEVPVNFPDAVAAGEPKTFLAPTGSLTLELRAAYDETPRRLEVVLAAGEEKEVVIKDEH